MTGQGTVLRPDGRRHRTVPCLPDGTADDVFEFKFNPDTGGELVWQYAAGVMVAKKPFSGIKIQVLYDFGANTIYFDGIQLYKEEFGNSYTYNDKGNVTSVKDLQGQTTQYEYASNNTDLLRVIQDNKATVTYTYDDYHNVKTATTEEGIVYEFEYDAYGNNTSVSIGSGDTKITSIAEYTDDFNRLEATTNAQGRKTLYSYHPDTNVLEWVQYPMDTAATRTEYTYDEMYRTAQAALTTDTGLALSAEYTYDNDLLMSIETASTTYDFAYGNFALRSSVDIGNWNLAEYSYESGTNRLLKLDYGNGDKVQYTYDDQGRVTKQTYEDNAYVTYKYDNSGALATVYDSETNTTSTYYYDFTDRMMKYVEKSGNNTHSVGYTYDDINNLTALVETVSNQEYTTSYSYDGDNRLTSLESDNVFQSYTYDAYGRVTQKTAKNGDQTVMDEAITYRNAGPGGITAQPFQLIYTGTNYSTTFGYGYNTNDNIAYVNQDGNTTYYYYDSANQLIREDNSTTDTTTLWTYDAAGNILRREVYPFSGAVPDPDAKISQVEYTYGDSDWGDLLTEYNGVEITYDGIGNPVNDGTWTYTWQHGRQLASMSRIGASEQWEFTYNADGMRTQRKKTGADSNITYNYTYLGDQLTHMTVGEHTMHFTYDGAGSPLSVTYGSETYYYVTNLQGDIVTILESDGTAVVHYAYDAWGNLISTTGDMADTLGFYNPLRYRGYVYDAETELYYLQSRYYNPEIGRFINADGLVSTGQGLVGNNMFAYCGNNPVANSDASGMMYIREAGFGGGVGGSGGGSGSGNISWSGNYVYPNGYVGVTVQTTAGVILLSEVTETISIPRPGLFPYGREDTKEVYAYSKALKYLPNITRKRTPHVHHIVPVGKFSIRNALTVQHINEMHERLTSVGINRAVDPMNLVIVSAGTHSTLHTNAYIAHVHSYIMSAEATQQGIYGALFLLRIEIAAMDSFAMGY